MTKIICTAILFLVFFSCDAPRRALITIGANKERNESLTSRQQANRERNTDSSQNKEKTDPGRRNRVSGNTNVAVFDLGYKSITDRETSFKWEPYFDNPTSLLRFLMGDQAYNKRLPKFEELTYFFDKLSSELRTNSDGEVAGQIWLQMDGNYISSTEVFTPDNKRLYRGLYWNFATKSFESVNLAAGDLVNIILITQQ